MKATRVALAVNNRQPLTMHHSLADAFNTGTPGAGDSLTSTFGSTGGSVTKQPYGLRVTLGNGAVVQLSARYDSNECAWEELNGAPVQPVTALTGAFSPVHAVLAVGHDSFFFGTQTSVNQPTVGHYTIGIAFPSSPRHDGVNTSRVCLAGTSNGSAFNTVARGYLPDGTSVLKTSNQIFSMISSTWGSGITGVFDPSVGDTMALANAIHARDLYGDVVFPTSGLIVWPSALGWDAVIVVDGKEYRPIALLSASSTLLVEAS